MRDDPVAPRLDADLAPVWEGWLALMDGRSAANGEGLSWLELSRYCEDHEIVGEARRRWCRLLKAVDRSYLLLINEKAKNGDAGTGNRRAADAGRSAAGAAGA